MAVITLNETIVKQIEEPAIVDKTITGIDYNEFFINPELKVITFETQYFNAANELVKTERKRIEGEDFDKWLQTEFATLIAVRGSLTNYLVYTGEIVGGTDTTPGA